jgi:hypothetical protein
MLPDLQHLLHMHECTFPVYPMSVSSRIIWQCAVGPPCTTVTNSITPRICNHSTIIGHVTSPQAMRAEQDREDASTSGGAECPSVKASTLRTAGWLGASG